MKIQKYEKSLHFDAVNGFFDGHMPPEAFFDPRYAFVALDGDTPAAFGCLIDTSASYAYGEWFKTNPSLSPFKRAKAFKALLGAIFATAKNLKKQFIIAIVPEKNAAALKLYRQMVKKGHGTESEHTFRFFCGRIS